MSKWKDKLKAVKLAAQARAILAKDEVTVAGKGYNSAIRFQKDKPLVKWYDSNIKGHTISQSEEILRRGVINGEITQEQSDTISSVIDFAGAWSK
jgi:hypothetical protein